MTIWSKIYQTGHEYGLLDHETVCRSIQEGDGRTVPSCFDPDVPDDFRRVSHRVIDLYTDNEELGPDQYLEEEIVVTGELLTGVAEVDKQHVHIVPCLKRLNEIRDDRKSDDGNPNMKELFDDCVRQHFRLEEHYMNICKYPQSHIKEHR